MISKKVGIVEEIADSSEVLDDIRVNINGQIQRAYNYPKLTGKVNIGDEVIGQLKDNRQLGWQFVSAEEAERNVENGNYYAHTLNNTVVAPPRMLISIMENNYQPDGSVVVPEVLRPYMGGLEVIHVSK